MTTVSNFMLRVPVSLMDDVKALATQDAVSVNQFLVQAAAEKVATLQSTRRPGQARCPRDAWRPWAHSGEGWDGDSYPR